MNTALVFSDYGFTYAAGDSPALTNVNLEIRGGCVTTVLSAQGVGKTTLLRAAAGLLGEIYHGEVVGSVTPVTRHPPPTAFFDGYVQVTLAVETVREELGLPLYAAGVNRADRDARVLAVARELRIDQLLDRPVTALSGGEEKLVGIAAALVPDATIHILDEPFEQLDVAHLSAVIRAIKRRARAGCLMLVGTGAVDIALNIADTAVVFGDSVWQVVNTPTYADIAPIASLGQSPVESFLADHQTPTAGIRSFRDAVRRAS